MDANREALEALVLHPSETLDVELKAWLFLDRPNPAEPEPKRVYPPEPL